MRFISTLTKTAVSFIDILLHLIFTKTNFSLIFFCHEVIGFWIF